MSTSGSPSAPLQVALQTLETEAGTLTVLASADGVVRASGYQAADELLARLRAKGAQVEVVEGELPASVVTALEKYHAGELGALDGVDVVQPGGPFYQEVWRAMRTIPAGTTMTYSELAEQAGRPAAVRAAGGACAANLAAPFVPCHRVVRTDGTLGGYAYGLTVKERLLSYERATSEQTLPV